LSLTALVLLSPTALTKVKLYASGLYGIDSNPHELSDALTNQQEDFLYGNFRLSANYDKLLYVKASAKKAQYFNDERADWFKGNIDLAIKSRFKIKKQRFRYKLSMSQSINDKTYVSRVTGLVATFGGQSIADRYDSTLTDYSGRLTFLSRQNTKFSLEYQQRSKSYEEFEIANLSNLDYDHSKLTFDINYKGSEKGYFFAEASYTLRDYLDRRAKDLLGGNIIDSDLGYSYSDFKAGYNYRPNKQLRWKYTFNYRQRNDNASGYWDADFAYISVYSKYILADYHILTGSLKYSKYTYENQLDLDLVELDEFNKEKQGFSLKLDYHWILATLYQTKLGLYVSLQASAFDHTNQDYQYQRNSAAVGIRWSL